MRRSMKCSGLLLVILLSSARLFSQTGGNQLDMTLQACIDYALQNSEMVKMSNLEREVSKAKVSEIKAVGLPQASIEGGAQYNYETQKNLLPPEFSFGGTNGPVSFQQEYAGDFAFKVNQLLFDGSYFVGLRAARTFRELAEKDHISSKIEVIEAVKKAYFTVLINKKRLSLVNKNIDRLSSVLRDTNILYENGFVESTDVDKLRVNYNNLIVEQKKLSKLSELSYDLLKFQMGMSLSDQIDLSQSIEDISFDAEQINALNYHNRVEYSKILTNEQLTLLDLKNNKVQYLPQLFASFAYGQNTQGASFGQLTDGDRWFGYGNVGVNIKIPVFDGLLKSSKIQQNRIQLDQLKWQKAMTQKSIDIEVRQSKIGLESNLESIDIQKQNMALAKRVYEVTEIKYKEGVGSNLELIEADAALKESETNYYNALYEVLIAKVELEKALGILLK